MKLKDLSTVLRSTTGAMQEAIVYDLDIAQDLASGCSVDYAVKHYGDMELERITAYWHCLVLSVHATTDKPDDEPDDEPEWFGVVRWRDEDISDELEDIGYPCTPDAVALVKRDLMTHWFTDHMIDAGYDYIRSVIDDHEDELNALCDD